MTRPWTVIMAVALAAVALPSAVAATPSQREGVARVARCLGQRATIVGTARPDTLSGSARRDVIVGGAGADLIQGRGGRDIICAGAGDDVVRAGAGADRVDGGSGFDVCAAAETSRACEERRDVPSLGRVAPGNYVTAFFRPRFTFTAGPGWTYREISRSTMLEFRRETDAPPAGALIFSSLAAREPVGAVVNQLLSRPLTVRSRAAAALAGALGERIDVFAAEETEVFSVGFQSLVAERGEMLRFYVVDVRGTTLVVMIASSEATFPAFAALAEDFLATVAFR